MAGGQRFQAQVTSWWMARILLATPIGAAYGLPSHCRAERIYCETTDAIDDIRVELSESATLFCQCKRSPSISANSESEWASVIKQCYRELRRAYPTTTERRFALIYGRSKQRLDAFKTLLDRYRTYPDGKSLEDAALNDQERSIAQDMQMLISTLDAEPEFLGIAAGQQELFRHLHIIQVQFEPGEPHYDQTTESLQQSALGKPEQIQPAVDGLRRIADDLIAQRGSMGIDDLRRQFHTMSIGLRDAPDFRSDFDHLATLSEEQIGVQESQGRLKLSVAVRYVSVERPVTDVMFQMAQKASFIVVGGAGAGKTGCMLALAKKLKQSGRRVVYWPADSLPYKSTQEIASHLQLQHSWSELFSEASAGNGANLIIDGLDALRDTASQDAYMKLMQLAINGGVQVIASIRSFDLHYSSFIQSIFPRTFELDATFSNPLFRSISHIFVPDLSQEELEQVLRRFPEVERVLAIAPALQKVVTNLFSLDILCKLLSDGMTPNELSAISTQSELFERFWEKRIRTDPVLGNELENALSELVDAMVLQRKLQITAPPWSSDVRRILFSAEIVRQPPALPGHLPQDLVEFTHHLLFDYAAELLFVRKRRTQLASELVHEDTWGLFLRPSLALFHRHVWKEARSEFWEILKALEQANVPPLQKIPGYLIVAEETKHISELEELAQSDGGEVQAAPIQGTVSAVEFSAGPRLFSIGSGEWWLEWAGILIASGNNKLVHLGRRLLHIAGEHFEKLSEAGRLLLNRAAISLIEFYMAQNYRSGVMTKPIEWICKTAASNIDSSLAIIRKSIDPIEMSRIGYSGGFQIAFNIDHLWGIAPTLVQEIYEIIFAHEERDDSPSEPMGGQILSIVSNKRQDFEGIGHCLEEKFSGFLAAAPIEAMHALVKVVDHYVEHRQSMGDLAEPKILQWGRDSVKFAEDACYIWDDGSFPDEVEQMLATWEQYLRELPSNPDSVAIWSQIRAILSEKNKYAALWRRLLKAAAASPEFFTERIWELLLNPAILLENETEEEARECIASFSDYLLAPQLAIIERKILDINESCFPETDNKEFLARHMKEKTARLLLSIPEIMRSPEAVNFLQVASIDEGELAAKLSRPRIYSSSSIVTEEEWLSQHRGIDVSSTQSKSLLEASRFLRDLSRQEITTGSVPDILARIENVAKLLKDIGGSVDPRLVENVESKITHGLSFIARSDAELSMDVQSKLYKHFDAVLKKEGSPMSPEEIAHFRGDVFGTFDESINATTGFMDLISERAVITDEDKIILHRLADSSDPRVRFHMGERIWSLLDKWPEFVWETLEKWTDDITGQNGSLGVLRGTLRDSWLWWLWARDKSRTTVLVQRLLTQAHASGDDEFRKGIGSWIGIIWITEDEEWAQEILHGQIDAMRDNLDELEGAEFTALRFVLPRDTDKEKKPQERERASIFIIQLLGAAHTNLMAFDVELKKLPPEKKPAELPAWVKQTAGFVHHTSRHFHSSADDFVKHQRDLPEDQRSANAAAWLEEKEPLLNAILNAKHPSIAFDLIRGLEALIELNVTQPLKWLRRVTELNSAEGLTTESLAADHTIGILERILAEHKVSLKEGTSLRSDFLAILNAYLSVGWERAMRLGMQIESIFR